ncbi:MAG: hypothetical protein ACP5I8_09365 [Phycisphaerae bacterium]
MKFLTAWTITSMMAVSGLAAATAQASLVATFNSDSVVTGSNVDGNLVIQESGLTISAMKIVYFSASSNSPTAPANGQIPLVDISGLCVRNTSINQFATLTVNLLDNGFVPVGNEPEVAAGAANVTFSGNIPESPQQDYFQNTITAGEASLSSADILYSPLQSGPIATYTSDLGGLVFTPSSPYSLGATITIGLNPGDTATLTMQTDPSPVSLPLPPTSAMLGVGLVGLAGMVMWRRHYGTNNRVLPRATA